MTNAAPYPSPEPADLAALALKLSDEISRRAVAHTARMDGLEERIREAETWLHRRAAHSERDRGCYRTGAALEPTGGHMLDDIALTGLDHLGAYGLLFLVQTALDHPGESLSGMMRILFASDTGSRIREWGGWSRGIWNRQFYIEETVTFLTSKKGMDPKQRWRREKKVTARQRYLADEIARCLDISVPDFPTRGDAFEWIRDHGGNPRFHQEPARPGLPWRSVEGSR